VWGVVAEW